MLKIQITKNELSIIQGYAQKAQLGGKSNIRTSDRMQTLAGDQLTAQLGEAALSKYITGSISLYEKTRQERDKDRWRGDNGSDLLGYKIDVKTSRARRGMNFPYNLWIREKEYHADTIYILAVIPENETDVYFLGWCYGEDVKNKNGDRYELNSRYMRKMHTFASETQPLPESV